MRKPISSLEVKVNSIKNVLSPMVMGVFIVGLSSVAPFDDFTFLKLLTGATTNVESLRDLWWG